MILFLDLSAKEMESKLVKLMNNRMFKKKNNNIEDSELNPDFIHAYIFVFDCSEVKTFDVVCQYIEAFHQTEESNLSIFDDKKNDGSKYNVKKVISVYAQLISTDSYWK